MGHILFRLQLQNLTGHTPLCGIDGGHAERGCGRFSAGGGVSYCGHINRKVLEFDFAVIPTLWVSHGGGRRNLQTMKDRHNSQEIPSLNNEVGQAHLGAQHYPSHPLIP